MSTTAHSVEQYTTRGRGMERKSRNKPESLGNGCCFAKFEKLYIKM